MRPDQTDRGTMPPRAGMSGDIPEPADATEDAAMMRRHERAGSPNIESATSWQEIKSRFVDDPAGALAAAEELVRHTVEQRMRDLRDEAVALCAREPDEDSSSTESLRTRLLRYQEYCERHDATMSH